MPTEYLRIGIVCLAAVIAGVFLGNGAVYFFNRIPGKWLVDYGEEPDEELLRPTSQRVKSTPWKYVFTGMFIVLGIRLGLDDPLYAIPSLLALWLLLEMSMADIKYQIVPDQLIMLLMICGIGFVSHHSGGFWDLIYGAAIGFGILFGLAFLTRLIYGTPAIGGADIKLFGALGLATGPTGIVFIMIATTFLSAGHFIWLMIRKKAKLSDNRPMIPYIALSTALYMVLFHKMLGAGRLMILF